MDLLSEERTPSETLQYALARERGQESQQKMRNTYTNTLQANPWFEKIQYIKRQNRGSQFSQLHNRDKFKTADAVATNFSLAT